MKVRLLADQTRQVRKMRRRLDAKANELDLAKQALQEKEVALKDKTHEYGRFKLELKAVRAAICSRRDGPG